MPKPFKAFAGMLMLLLFSFPIMAQKLINGHVLSSVDQTPIPSATIMLKGTKTGAVTNVDGSFQLKAEIGDILVITGLGISKTEFKITGTEITIPVAANASDLNEVVVTATGVKKEVKRLGYAIQDVKAADLTQAREPSVLNALKGNVAGLTINITGEIGHSPDVIMRGEGTPMYVVDGVPLSSDTYNINPDDIESFTVLKGPSAAALYGFRGKEGAIIINTKRGSKNKRGFSVEVNTSTQFNKGFISLPKYQDDYGAGEYGKYAFGDGKGSGVNDYDYDVWGPKLDGRLLPQYDGAYDANTTYTTTFEDGTSFNGHIKPTAWVPRGKNNLTRFLQTGLLNSLSVAVSSSTEKTDLRFSLGNSYQRGIVPNTDLNNFNASGSIGYKFSKRFTMNTYFNYSRQSTKNIPDVQYGPNSIIYDMVLWGGADWNVDDMRDYWQPGKVGVQQKYAEYYRYNNPWFMSKEWLRGHYVNNVSGYTSLNYNVNSAIDITLRPSITTYNFTNTEKLPYSATVYDRPEHKGDYRVDNRSLFESNVELQAKYHKNAILGFLDVQGLIGANSRNFRFNSAFTTTNYLNVPGVYSFSNSLNPIQAASYNADMKVLSGYYSVDLGYKAYVTANITGRFDKSSTLPASNNTYFYPSFNLATVISDYVKMPSAISFLKLRASYAESKDGGTNKYFSPNVGTLAGGGYGYTFNSPYDGPSYRFTQTYRLSSYYKNQNSAVYSDELVDNNIKTANRKAYEFGIDMRFLENRLSLDATRYRYKNYLIFSADVSQASGYSNLLKNQGITENNGWEVTLNASPFKKRNGFSWDVNVNWFKFVRTWVDKPSGDNYVHSGTRYDLVTGDAFVRTSAGKLVIDQTSGLLLRYSDLGVNAQKVFGHADPDWQWGITNTFSYKRFAFRFKFDGMVGGVIEDYVRKKTLQAGRHTETIEGKFGAARPNDALGSSGFSYVGDGVNLTGGSIILDPITGKISNEKALTESSNTTKTSVQQYATRMASVPDLDIIKKTYAKLREVTFTYNIPSNLFGGQALIQQASISFVGRNLLYFFPNRYKDMDIDQYTMDSGSALQTPTTRSYGFNLNVTF
ncbi:TonB-linked outer membrane protein, SusC/RagA family [Chitinophaga sp. CF118]|uniref:SusC/RagA family TonB-linked outer membrane protein n=1 Tax=Chitinophaga sp. CF118 TaxID=1884367 RepID=UPI0008E0C463|nr:SusC/RagA family TonB-linked outer membrane protein [Chitinophaga sp. CF118]SFD02073.1 TonB-linked outer membrane protein, SusC/RagA family [Chitinophaga sp. CF118]